VENELTQQEAQNLWNEEAKKLDAEDAVPEFETQSANLDEPAQVEQQPEGQPEDPLAGLPEPVRQALARITELESANTQLLHHVKTAEGRVAAMQREFQQARQAQQTVAPDDAPSQGQMSAAARNPEKWEQLKQDFPEWASAMEEYVGAKLSDVRGGVQALQVADYVQEQLASAKADMRVAIEEARIEGKYDDWRTTVATPEFSQWFALQPAEVKSLADSTAGKDAIKMLDLFSTARAKPASEIRQERGARLAAAATSRPGQTPPPKTLDDLSPEDLWNYEAKKREEQLAKRGY
jgi:hypothetical protein